MSEQPGGEIVLYQREDGPAIDVRLDGNSVWLSQAQMARLFQTTPQNITLHLKAIYADGEQIEASTCKDYLQVRQEGNRKVKRNLKHYNLEAILAVGYRVRSARGVHFRQWATERLREYLVKGFALNDERFKSGSSMNYFNELQERIREIRLSERFFYQKIKDIYATSIDYDPTDEKTIQFFKVVQNKLLWAISEQTAAELVYRRSDAALPLMGMQSFEKAENAIQKKDVGIAKNYLQESEIRLLGLLVEQYLAFAEAMAQQHIPMYMADWITRLDAIIQLNGRELLTHAGTISHQMAVQKSADEYERFKLKQQISQKEHNLAELEQDMKKLLGEKK